MKAPDGSVTPAIIISQLMTRFGEHGIAEACEVARGPERVIKLQQSLIAQIRKVVRHQFSAAARPLHAGLQIPARRFRPHSGQGAGRSGGMAEW